eukprot:4173589-Amphidinium_carterae.1
MFHGCKQITRAVQNVHSYGAAASGHTLHDSGEPIVTYCTSDRGYARCHQTSHLQCHEHATA